MSTSKPPKCIYPGSNPTARPILEELNGVAANAQKCSRFYLDTIESMKGRPHGAEEGDDHHQGLARSHRLSDGSIYFFLSHSETDPGEKGVLAQFRYSGPTDDEHIVETDPLTVAPMQELLRIEEQHPSDICFLPDVNHTDSGYLFVTEEFHKHRVAVYQWEPSSPLNLLGHIQQGFPQGAPNFLFLDRVNDLYFLGIASNNTGWGKLFSAKTTALFPKCVAGGMNISAFQPVTPESMFPFPPIESPSQVKLIQDSTGAWFLLAFRSDPEDDPHGTDFVDVYGVQFEPYFYISYRLDSVHVAFRPGNTGFSSTGTHHVEKSGRLLVASSYRWSSDEGPGDSSYVSRVDECPSS